MKFTAAILLFISLKSFGKIQTQVNYSPIANLVYQMDCHTGKIHCSRKNIQKLWADEFLKTPEDKENLKKWDSIMSRYDQSMDLGEQQKSNSPAPRYSGISFYSKIRLASLQSKDRSEYFNRLDLVLTSADRTTIQNIVNHFYPAFEKWWFKVAAFKGKIFVDKTEALLKKSSVNEKLDQFSHFYATTLPDKYLVTLNLFFRPELVQEPTSGEQIENYAVIEFMEKEDPRDRIDVIIHELCHFLYYSGSEVQLADLKKSMAAIKPHGIAAYNLLNEAIATTLGNGIINRVMMSEESWKRHISTPNSFYYDYFTDTAAKALLPWLEEWLKKNKTIYDKNFSKEYYALLEKTFGQELGAPQLLFKEMFLFSDTGYEDTSFRTYVRKALRVNSQYSSEGDLSQAEHLKSYFEHGSINAILIVHPSHLERLKALKVVTEAQLTALKKSYKDKKMVLHALNTPNQRAVYILVGQNSAVVQKLIDQLQQMKTGFVSTYNHGYFFPSSSFAIH